MATNFTNALKTKGNHGVGNIMTAPLDRKLVANGGKIIDKAVDNFTLVESVGYDEDGNLQVKQLTDNTKSSYLVTTSVVLPTGLTNLPEYFYNDVDEMAKLDVMIPEITRFETSTYELNEGVTEIKCGMVAYFDTTKKKFVISNAEAPATDYDGAKTKLEVVNPDGDSFNSPTVMFKVIAN